MHAHVPAMTKSPLISEHSAPTGKSTIISLGELGGLGLKNRDSLGPGGAHDRHGVITPRGRTVTPQERELGALEFLLPRINHLHSWNMHAGLSSSFASRHEFEPQDACRPDTIPTSTKGAHRCDSHVTRLAPK